MNAILWRTVARHAASIIGSVLVAYGLVAPEQGPATAEALVAVGTALAGGSLGQSLIEKLKAKP